MRSVTTRKLVPGALAAALTAVLAAACATTPSGRNQLLLVSGSEMAQMGATSFEQLKRSDKLARDPVRLRQAQCVVQALTAALPGNARQGWEVQLFDDANPNAFALPGGKVGVNTGMFSIARTDDQLAGVLAHEIAHVIFQHANERVSQQMATGIGVQALGAYTGRRTSPQTTQMLMSALGLGAQLGVLLPYSRKHESEADVYGQQYMARAGFDPNGAVSLWQNMIAASRSGRPPTILSTHPDPQNRVRALAANVPSLMAEYNNARASGRAPNCY
jgi:predicted Zn-dependent protease